MADTRCVNPEYQLDVDQMILEYLLHQALRSFFESVKTPGIDEEGMKNDDISSIYAAGLNITGMFDAFIRMFRIQHPNHELSAGTKFNICLLETVLLLRDDEINVLTNDSVVGPADSKSRMCRYEEWHKQLQERENWLMLRSSSECHQADKSDLEMENIVFTAWFDYRSAMEREDGPQCPPSPLFGVLHRFISLSADVEHAIDEKINRTLMQLACDAMLQTALEVLSLSGWPVHKPEPLTEQAPVSHTPYDHYDVPSLSQIFAYGYIPDPPELSSDNETPSSINQIFSETVTDPNNATPTTIERPEWTSLRHDTIREFQIPLRSLQDHTVYAARLTRLKHKYPFDAFHTNMLSCLKNFWDINCEPSVSGKPDLVQIEEGGLQGLSKEEFEEFLENCGIKRHDDKGDAGSGLNFERSLIGQLSSGTTKPASSAR